MYLGFGPFEGSRVAIDEFIKSYNGVGWREMKMHVGVSSQPTILFWLVSGKIIQNHMDFLIEMSGQDSVHELDEFPATAASVVAGLNSAGGNV